MQTYLYRQWLKTMQEKSNGDFGLSTVKFPDISAFQQLLEQNFHKCYSHGRMEGGWLPPGMRNIFTRIPFFQEANYILKYDSVIFVTGEMLLVVSNHCCRLLKGLFQKSPISTGGSDRLKPGNKTAFNALSIKGLFPRTPNLRLSIALSVLHEKIA